MAFPASDEGVDARSFYLGMCCAFIEVVGLGAKRLALSPPMPADDIRALKGPVDAFAAEFGVMTRVEQSPLETKLFNPGFTADKQVILFALDGEAFAEYEALQVAGRRSIEAGKPAEAEDEIARRFGRLLSYSESAIEDLLQTPRF